MGLLEHEALQQDKKVALKNTGVKLRGVATQVNAQDVGDGGVCDVQLGSVEVFSQYPKVA
jgi:hypothetical protein